MPKICKVPSSLYQNFVEIGQFLTMDSCFSLHGLLPLILPNSWTWLRPSTTMHHAQPYLHMSNETKTPPTYSSSFNVKPNSPYLQLEIKLTKFKIKHTFLSKPRCQEVQIQHKLHLFLALILKMVSKRQWIMYLLKWIYCWKVEHFSIVGILFTHKILQLTQYQLILWWNFVVLWSIIYGYLDW